MSFSTSQILMNARMASTIAMPLHAVRTLQAHILVYAMLVTKAMVVRVQVTYIKH